MKLGAILSLAAALAGDAAAAASSHLRHDDARRSLQDGTTGPTAIPGPTGAAVIVSQESSGSNEPVVSGGPAPAATGAPPGPPGLPGLSPSILCLMGGLQTVEECCASAGEGDAVCTMLTCLDVADLSLGPGCRCGMIEAACAGVVAFDAMVPGIADTCAQVDACCEDDTENGDFDACLSGAIAAGDITPPNFAALLSSVSGPGDADAVATTPATPAATTTAATQPAATDPPAVGTGTNDAGMRAVETLAYIAGSALAVAFL